MIMIILVANEIRCNSYLCISNSHRAHVMAFINVYVFTLAIEQLAKYIVCVFADHIPKICDL